MKYCAKCKVNVHHQLNNCPLCGSYLDEKHNNDKCAMYTEMDSIVKYPILKEKQTFGFFHFKFSGIMLVLMLVSVLLNIFLSPQYHWSAYVVIASVFVQLCIINPINLKTKLVKQIKIALPVVAILAVAMEFCICNWQFKWFTVEYVIPWFFVASIVLMDFLIVFLRKQNRELFSTLMYCTFGAMLPQIALWIAQALSWYTPKTVVCIVVFFASLANSAIVFIVCAKSLKEEMERQLSV